MTNRRVEVRATNAANKVYRSLPAFNPTGIPADAKVRSRTRRFGLPQRANPIASHIGRLCGERGLDDQGQSEARATQSNVIEFDRTDVATVANRAATSITWTVP